MAMNILDIACNKIIVFNNTIPKLIIQIGACAHQLILC